MAPIVAIFVIAVIATVYLLATCIPTVAIF
jgi:hypothetical protein